MERVDRVETTGFWDFRKQLPDMQPDLPLQLAENLPLHVVEESRRHFSERKTPDGLVQSAWRMIEYAMARDVPIDTELRKSYISYYTPQLLADVLAMSKEGNPLYRYDPDYTASPQQQHFHQALTIGAHVPLFSRRATGEDITSQDCRNLHASMIAVVKEELRLGPNIQYARLSENVTTLLSTRTSQPEYILHLASPREEASHKEESSPEESRRSKHLNHDRYFIQDGVKVPVQIKIGQTAARYADCVHVLDIEGMLEFAARRSNYQIPISSETHQIAPHVHVTAQLLAGEHDKEFFYPEERAFLNIASQAVVSIYKNAQRIGVAA